MKTEYLEIEAALQKGHKLPYAMLQYLSRVHLGKTPDDILTDELLEARFFGEEEEIRIFLQDGHRQAVSLQKEAADRTARREYHIANQHFGTTLVLTDYFNTDEDGQTYIADTCLSAWKGAEGNA